MGWLLFSAGEVALGLEPVCDGVTAALGLVELVARLAITS